MSNNPGRANSHLLSAIITRATDRCALEFANEFLFVSIGINEIPADAQNAFNRNDVFRNKTVRRLNDPQGNSLGGWDLALTPPE
ncbi:MAG: hypothetical protein JXB88_22730 [Spirochaetales bacterium]|nr:hypothetical protein [Spirochaetales bacterium]